MRRFIRKTLLKRVTAATLIAAIIQGATVASQEGNATKRPGPRLIEARAESVGMSTEVIGQLSRNASR
jgi:hypothetical protein